MTGKFKENLETHGVSTVILPIMMDLGGRITDSHIKIAYQALMFYTVIYPNFDQNEPMPNF